MKKLKWQIWLILLIDLLLLVVGGLNTVNVYHRAGLPFPTRSESDTVWIEKDTIINKIKLDSGDILLSVDKINVKELIEIEYILDFHDVGNSVEIGIKSGDVYKTGIVKLKYYYENSDVIIFIITSMLMFFVALTCLLTKPEQKSVVIFHHAAFAAGMMVLMTWGKIGYFPSWIDFICRVFYDTCFIFTPILFFHFSLYFPKDNHTPLTKYIKFIYLTGFFGFTLISYKILMALHPVNLENFLLYHEFHRYMVVYFFVFLFFSSGVFNFIRTYITSSDLIDKRKILWILIGTSIGPLVFVFLYQIPKHSGIGYELISESLMTILVCISPITMAIGILRYRLFDIEFIINRSTVYFIVLVTIVGLFFAPLAIIHQIVSNDSLNVFDHVTLLILSIVVAIIYQPVKSKVQRFIDKRFFKINYNFRVAQQEFIDAIKQCYTMDNVAQLCISTIMKNIPVEKHAFLTYNPELERFVMRAGSEFIYDVGSISKITDISRYYSGQNVFAHSRFMEDGIAYYPDESGLLDNIGSELFLASVDNEKEPICLIILGKKKSGFKFTVEDIGMLKMMSYQTTEAIQRINLQKKLVIKEEETQRLEELSSIKSYFVSSVSHELKTPLTSIRLFAEIMQMKKNIDEAKKDEYLDIIQSECDRLNRLIGNVLDFSKIEKGVKEYRLTKVSLTDILKGVLKTFEYQFKAQGFKVNVNISDSPMIINGDQDAIAESLINLISNAMKYSFDVKEVEIKSTISDEFYIIEISDKGCGIKSSDLEQIFDPFFRSKDVSQTGGAGIGLSLVESNMKAHKGYVKVNSEYGQGSSFALYFPISDT